MANYLKWFLSLPQEQRIKLMKRYSHIHDVENMNEPMAEAIFHAVQRELTAYSNVMFNKDDAVLCPQCYTKTIIDCMDKKCLNYDPK